MKNRVIIIGAGFAGLSTAYELTKSGFDVKIIEEKPYTGGLCYTINKNGFRFDIGGHRLYTKSQEVFDFLNNLLGKENFIERQRISRIFLNRKFFDYPLKFSNIIFRQKVSTIVRIMMDFFFIQIKYSFVKRDPGKELSFESWVISRFGKTLYNIYFKEYTQKVWREDPKELHHELASRRISFSNLKQVIVKLVGISPKKTPRTYITDLYYPKYGIGQIANAMVKEIEDRGGKIITGMSFREVKGAENRISHILCDNAETGHTEKLEADYYLSTIPLTTLSRALYNEKLINISEDKLNKLRYKGISILYLMINEKTTFPDTWLYIPESKYIVFRVVNFTNWSPHMAPEGKSAICLEISLDKSESFTDEQLYERATMDMEELGLIKKSWIEGYFVEHFPHAYPIYFIDYDLILDELNNEIKPIENLISYGRQGAYNYTTMDNTLRNGFEMARHLVIQAENEDVAIYNEKFSLINNAFQELS